MQQKECYVGTSPFASNYVTSSYLPRFNASKNIGGGLRGLLRGSPKQLVSVTDAFDVLQEIKPAPGTTFFTPGSKHMGKTFHCAYDMEYAAFHV